MSQVQLIETVYSKYKKALLLTNGVIELVATLDVGPRIIRFNFVGEDNILFEDEHDKINRSSPDMKVYGEDSTWHIYGGHRLWTSPEISPRTYYPDNLPIQFAKMKNGVRLIPPQQDWANLQLEIDIKIKGDNEVELKHIVTNKGAWDIQLAPWAITVLADGGVEVVPMPKRQPELLPNRVIGLWPYSDMADKRVTWGTDYIMLRPDPKVKGKFKFGINNEEGYAIYFINGNMFVKQFEAVVEGNYPDGGLNYETYTKDDMIEMETLGELKTLSPGDSTTLTEVWRLIKDVPLLKTEEEISRIVKKHIKKRGIFKWLDA